IKGPDAAVGVIPETKYRPTTFNKIVVPGDLGRFVVPDLPAATYSVWVRGYGLVDSMPIRTKPTPNAVTLQATTAKSPQEAAQVYPGNYWLSLLEPPGKGEFPGTGSDGNGFGPALPFPKRLGHSLKARCHFLPPLRNPAQPP